MGEVVKGEGLRKDERLRKSRDFRVIAKEGDRRHTRNFLVISRRNDVKFCRVGAVASKQVGKAVERNRVKRLIREFFRRNKDKLLPGTDYIIVGRKGAQDLDYGQVVQELSPVLQVRRGDERRSGESAL